MVVPQSVINRSEKDRFSMKILIGLRSCGFFIVTKITRELLKMENTAFKNMRNDKMLYPDLGNMVGFAVKFSVRSAKVILEYISINNFFLPDSYALRCYSFCSSCFLAVMFNLQNCF